MKKINLLFSLLVLTFYSCNDNEEVPNDNESYNKRHYSNVNYGKIHNDFMSFIKDDLVIDRSITTKTDAYKYVSFFLKEKAMLHQDIDQEEKILLCNAFDENIFLLEIGNVQAIIKNEVTIGNTIRGEHTTLSILLEDLKNLEIISVQEFEKIIFFQDMLSKVYNGEMGITELSSYLNQEANANNSNVVFNSLIDIGIASNQWWNENTPSIFLPFPINEEIYPSDGQYQIYAIPVATDVAGALIMGATSVAVQYGVTGEVNWKVAGVSAVAGAVLGSTGAVGKLGNWISNLF